MKKCIALAVLVIAILTGCADKTVVPEIGDFSFALPDGYVTADVTAQNCTIVRNSDSQTVGGIEITTLNLKDIEGKKTDNVMMYLQNAFHKTYDVEYIATHWGDKHKVVAVNLEKHEEAGGETSYYHLFFEKDSGVYHIWLNKDVLGADQEREFLQVTGVD